MSNPGNDNRLEELSREAAGAYTPPGNASWEKMEAALDKVMPVEEKKRRRFIFWWLFPLAIIGAGTLYLVWPDPATLAPKPSGIKVYADPNQNNTPINQQPLTGDQTKTASAPPAVTDQHSLPQKNNQPHAGNTVSGNKTVVKKTVAATVNSKTTTATVTNLKEQSVTQQTGKQDITADATTQKTTIASEKNNTSTTDAIALTATTVQQKTDSVASGNNEPVNRIITATDSLGNHQQAVTDSLQTNKNTPTPKKTGDSKFSFALVAGMDASTVKFRYSDKAGINAGFITGYHFNETWSLHTGVLFTRKNYTVAGEDFTAPKGSWVANYKLTMVDGYCDMWEVPLLLRYQFKGENKRSFFVSGGISSYFMTRENYNYSYYWNGMPVTRNNNYPNGNTHLLSILRLSAGWRKSIGQGTSVLIEPYASLPLSGVGYGSIRLSSFGLNFSLQLRQPYHSK